MLEIGSLSKKSLHDDVNKPQAATIGKKYIFFKFSFIILYYLEINIQTYRNRFTQRIQFTVSPSSS